VKSNPIKIKTTSLIPSKKLEKILTQSRKDIQNGVNLSPAFSDPKEMDEYLEFKESFKKKVLRSAKSKGMISLQKVKMKYL
jgi:hypothetical protein